MLVGSLNYVSIAFILCHRYCVLSTLFGQTIAAAAEKREKYLRNNWTGRKCFGIKLSKVTADAVYRWLVYSTIFFFFICCALSFIWCSLLLFNKCLTTSQRERARPEASNGNWVNKMLIAIFNWCGMLEIGSKTICYPALTEWICNVIKFLFWSHVN